jgi:hypothetical protein
VPIVRLSHAALAANRHAARAVREPRRARALVFGDGRRLVYEALPSRDLQGLFAAFRRAAALQ